MHGRGLRAGRHVGDAPALRRIGRPRLVAAVAREREEDVNLGVLRKRLRAGHIDGAAARVHAVAGRPEARDHAVHVAHQEVGGIDEHAAVGFGANRKAPQHRRGEGFFDRAALIGIGAERAIGVVRLDHQHLRADAPERDDVLRAQLAAVEADVVRAESCRERGDVEELGVELRDLEPQRARAVVPVQRHEPIELLQALRLLVDRRRGCLRREGRGAHEQCEESGMERFHDAGHSNF